MQIAGGLYRERCEMPAWNVELGSGGRAAAAVSVLSPGSVFHTYAVRDDTDGIAALRSLGIDVRVQPSNVSVAFAYFHPLSDPYVEPPLKEVTQQEAIRVSAETVLRFGFVEGEAIVDAERAVYDPQSLVNPQPFGANGSRARELALVMNELELRGATGSEELGDCAARLLQDPNVAVVIAKAGARGAFVFDRNGASKSVPAYRSSRVFKIGTGDVFSSMFAYYWGEKRLSPFEAADSASRSVAVYCNTRQLPINPKAAGDLRPVGGVPRGPIMLEGRVDSLGRRYVMEEARFRLGQLGAPVRCPTLEAKAISTDAQLSACLIIADGQHSTTIGDHLHRFGSSGLPIVILAEEGAEGLGKFASPQISITDDFSSALYFAIWASSVNPH